MYSDFATTTEGVFDEDTNKRNRILSLWRLRNFVPIVSLYLFVFIECFLMTAIAGQRDLSLRKKTSANQSLQQSLEWMLIRIPLISKLK